MIYNIFGDESQGTETVNQEKAAEIAVNWVTVFYHVQVGAIETQEFKSSKQARSRIGFSVFRTRSRAHYSDAFRCLSP